VFVAEAHAVFATLHTQPVKGELDVDVEKQGVQVPAPAPEYWPVEQAVHEELVPGFEPLPIVEYEPAGHVPHSAVEPAAL
jgi:hypothetical protein